MDPPFYGADTVRTTEVELESIVEARVASLKNTFAALG
jgi:hypothetical protein